MLATYLGQYRGDLCTSPTIAGDVVVAGRMAGAREWAVAGGWQVLENGWSVVVAGEWQSLEYGRR
jgi:hypothetical protein